MNDRSLDSFYAGLDRLYEEKKMDEIEGYLRRAMQEHRICCGGHDMVFTAALNELGTYYRSIGKYEDSAQCFKEAGVDILGYGTSDTVHYATNRVNLAGTLRLMKQFDEAIKLYREAASIYERIAGKKSYYYATVLNNMALVYLDLERYEDALYVSEKALHIVHVLPKAREEEAISLINKAAALRGLGRKAEGRVAANQALDIYESLTEKGLHYAAALNISGAFALDDGDYSKASTLFIMAANVTASFVGKNEEYDKAMENAGIALSKLNEMSSPDTGVDLDTHGQQCCPDEVGYGMELCRAYFDEVGFPMLRESFSSVLDRMAVGLVGDGSECYGFDDAVSRDHDWGPGFCIWLTNNDYAVFGEELQRAYDRLPKSFRGYTRHDTEEGKHRVGVLRISDFYRQYTGLSRIPEKLGEWNRIPESFLAKATNGAVFMDGPGVFSSIRKGLLGYYPEDVRLKKISVRAAQMAQSGQYNYARCLCRDDMVAAKWTLLRFIKATISMTYLLNKKYAPYYKWIHRGLKDLTILPQMYEKIRNLIAADETKKVPLALIEDICTDVRVEWDNQDICHGTSNFLLSYSPIIISKICDAGLRGLPIMQEWEG